MFGDPALPSTPPPPPDATVRPMSYFGAALWITGIQMSFMWILLALVAVREASESDLVAQIICQVIAYGLGLFLLLRVHGPNMRIRDFVAWRRTSVWLHPLALLLGFAVAVPAASLFNAIERRWPPVEQGSELVELFYQASTAGRVAMTLGVVVVGPFIEEVLFRGAIFGPLRSKKEAAPVILVTAAYFALVHIDPRRLVPIFLVGLLLGYLRAASGSLVPAALLHMAFNAVPLMGMWLQDRPSPGEEIEPVPPGLLFGSIAACLVLVLVVYWTAAVSRAAAGARRADIAGARVD